MDRIADDVLECSGDPVLIALDPTRLLGGLPYDSASETRGFEGGISRDTVREHGKVDMLASECRWICIETRKVEELADQSIKV